jgi:O-antigen/teichoic acid export membrane protein
LLLLIDFWLPNARFHPANDPALLNVRPQLVEWLSAQPGDWRLTSFDDKGEKPFNANSGWLFNLQDVRGYDSIIPRQYTDYMAAIEPQNELQFNRVQPIANWQSLNSPLLDVLGVKYIISTQPLDELPKLERVWEGEGVLVYENLAAAPRAYMLPAGTAVVAPDPLAAMGSYDPRFHVVIAEDDWDGPPPATSEPAEYVPAAVTAYSNREVVVEAAVTEPSWLVLNDSYFPGWRVWVRPSGASSDAETELPLTRVNGNFRGVQLEPGSWIVRFRYSPNSFLLGGLASFMGMIVLLFGSIVWGWRRFYRREATQSAGASIAKNSLAPIFLNLFNKLIDFGYAAYFLRVLGPAGAGSFQTAIVTAGIFDIISNYGLDILLIRDVSSKRERAGHYLLNTTLLRLGAAAVATLPVLGIIGSTRLFDSANALTGAEVTATLLIMAGMVFSGMSKGVTGLFYVHEEAETPNAMTTVTTILKVGFGVVALTLGYGFVGLAAVSILTNLITLALLVTLALRRYRLQGPWQVDSALLRQMVRAGFPLMLIHLLQTVFISIDTVLLRVMLRNGQEVVGWYSSAYKWFNALQIVPSFFTLALFPIISREIGANMARARQMYGTAIKIMLLLALPIAMMTHIWAVPLVQIVAGNEFLPAGAIALQIVVWSIPLGWMNSVTNYVLISLGLERLQPRAFGIAVTFNIVTNLIFIPFFSYQAAAVTTILSELVLLVLFESFLRKRMPGVAWGEMLLRPFILTAFTFGVMWGLAQLHILLAPLGLLLYPAGLFGLRIITAEERAFFLKLLPAGIGRRLGVQQEG